MCSHEDAGVARDDIEVNKINSSEIPNCSTNVYDSNLESYPSFRTRAFFAQVGSGSCKVSYMHFLHMCSTLNNELVSKNSIMQIMHITFFRKIT